MSMEINKENDFAYLQSYLNKELKKDLAKSLQLNVMDKESFNIIENHFTLYNKAIKGLKQDNLYFKDENDLLKKALEFNSSLIEKLKNQIDKNTIEIESIKKEKKGWFN